MKVYEVKKPKRAMKSYKNYSHTGDKDLTRIVKKFESGKYSKTPCGK